ncbi:MAG TPA: biotin/lipoyl-binding protein [Pseudonocardia sp.]|jgi:HlyD family secretion protein|nr:biotin/lipoyl-binding protein [Pseudonocardia sp.]
MSRTTVRGGTGARIALAVSLVMVSAMAMACSEAPKPAPVARVERGTVANKVQASGALAAVTSQNLGFAKGAQLKELDVKVGDQVRPGQVLARIDDFAFRQALAQQQAQLDQQQAGLNKVVNGNSVHAGQTTLAQAKRILDATKDNVDAQDKANGTTIDRARTQLTFDQAQLDLARQQADRDGCEPGEVTSDRAAQALPAPTTTNPTGTGSTGSGTTGSTTTGSGSGSTDPDDDDSEAPEPPRSGLSVRGWRSTHSSTQLPTTSTGTTGATTPTTSPTATTTPAATDTSCATDNQNVTAAQRQVISSQTAVDTAKRARDVDKTTGQLSVENAKQSVVSAQNTLDSANGDRPSDIDAQAALVASARAAVALAQRDVDNSVLYAPVGGTVSAINGAVGEYLGTADSGTTALAPGTNASIPGVGAAATSDQAGNNGPSATRPGGAAFLVLNNIDTYQIVVPFEESDAVKIAANQQVEVTFDAVPDLTRPGTVLSVAPNGIDISGVTNFYATILLTQTDPRLRDGLTAEVGVLVNALNNVLVVPNNAVLRQGSQTFVNTPGPDGKPLRVPFQAGAAGDDNTQVLSGLNEGQPILLPEARVAPGTTGGAGGGGGGGGGGRGGG